MIYFLTLTAIPMTAWVSSTKGWTTCSSGTWLYFHGHFTSEAVSALSNAKHCDLTAREHIMLTMEIERAVAAVARLID